MGRPKINPLGVLHPTYDQLWAPIVGPAHPYAKDGIAQGMRNHKRRFVEEAAIESFVFDEQYNTFQKYGYAADPSASTGYNYGGDIDALQKNDALSVYSIPQQEQTRRRLEKKRKEEEAVGGDEGGVDPDFDSAEEGPQPELTEEQKKYAEEHVEEKGRDKVDAVPDRSTFHGKEEKDYQGRLWISPAKDAKAANDRCYIRKRLVHTWSGHTKGVWNLILSAGMDAKVKIWDVFNTGKCMRTYMGHSMPVRDISFSTDGTKFLSAGYDKKIKYWDTETGQVISTFSTGITQEYGQHLGAVNTITFADNNRRFVTPSDDKSLRVWEFGMPAVIKYISEPQMHSMPAISLHPNSNWLAAQSLDNQILIYSTRERFQLNKKKRFAGHTVGGYACQSGDGEGRCWFWDWKTCKVHGTLKCREGVCIGVEWHPLEQRKLATCGWDGLIKYWD
uniref:Pre-mRNA splicing factor n=1 Tax=Kalanchoe fedtschenkoi TaxID=63787 RepID=A0A7N0U0Y2_KALFE